MIGYKIAKVQFRNKEIRFIFYFLLNLAKLIH